jgi:hypothetical protein
LLRPLCPAAKPEADYTPWHYSVTLTTKSGLPDWVAIRANPNLLTLNDILWLSLSTIVEAHMQPDQEFAKSTSPERVYVQWAALDRKDRTI